MEGASELRAAFADGTEGAAGRIVIQVSQADLAFMLNISRQTVTRELGALARSELMSQGYGTVVLEDL